MRLLLDAHLSSRRIGQRLRWAGHDVRALADDSSLEGLEDRLVLELAAGDGRILVTRNSRDFAPILRDWAEGGRDHAGAILIWTLGHGEFDAIVTGVERLLRERPSPDQWRGVTTAM